MTTSELPTTAEPATLAESARTARSRLGVLRGYWVPVLLLALLAALTGFGVNGSSAAVIRDYLGSSATSDPHLVLGTARAIRSDEWAVNTPLTIMQVRTGMPRIQPLLGDGVDMAVAHDVPVAEGWEVFRPQHWGFLALPLDQGFAFFWWLPPFLLVFAMWWLVVTLMPGRNVLGLLIGAAAAFSPFLQWWYLSGSFVPAACAVLTTVLVIRIVRASSKRQLLGYAVLLSWVLACFVRVLYPPFQIPCALVAGAFCIGYLINAARDLGWRRVLTRLGVVAGCIVTTGGLVALFVLDHRNAIEAIAGSAYPGHRTVGTGGYSVTRLFSGFLDRKLVDPNAAQLIAINQSEAATPLLAGVLAAPLLVWLIVAALRHRQRPNAVAVSLLAVLVLFLVHLFVPHADIVASLTLLDRVPQTRLLMGLGLLSDLLLVTTVWMTASSPRLRVAVLTVSFVMSFAGLLLVTLRLSNEHAIFVGSLVVAVVLAAGLAFGVALSAARRPAVGVVVLLAVTLAIAGGVNPLNRGVATTDDLPIGRAVGQINGAEPGGWITQISGVGSIGLLPEQGAHTYVASYPYPQLELWRELDPAGIHTEEYNRYGLADLSLQRGPTRFLGHTSDTFSVAIDGCAPFVRTRVRHVLSDHPIDAGCVTLRQIQQSGSIRYYFYDVTPAA